MTSPEVLTPLNYKMVVEHTISSKDLTPTHGNRSPSVLFDSNLCTPPHFKMTSPITPSSSSSSSASSLSKYVNLGTIGEGSYGLVLKCKHRETGRLVAIKKFIESEDDRSVRKIAMREIHLLKQLRHENLVNLLEVFRRKRRLYLVFEFVDKSLLDHLELSPNGLEKGQCRRVLHQVIRALEFCHVHNIIHRDVKPENILISKNGVVKLCDFGFARTLAKPGEIYTEYVSTRWYRAPELLVGDARYGRAVDIWALGCLNAEMLTGQPLFPGDSDIDQLFSIVKCFGGLCHRHEDKLYNNPSFRFEISQIEVAEPLKCRLRGCTAREFQFVALCLELDPYDRPTCSALLQHPLFACDGFASWFPEEMQEMLRKDEEEDRTLLENPHKPKRFLPDIRKCLELSHEPNEPATPRGPVHQNESVFPNKTESNTINKTKDTNNCNAINNQNNKNSSNNKSNCNYNVKQSSYTSGQKRFGQSDLNTSFCSLDDPDGSFYKSFDQSCNSTYLSFASMNIGDEPKNPDNLEKNNNNNNSSSNNNNDNSSNNNNKSNMKKNDDNNKKKIVVIKRNHDNNIPTAKKGHNAPQPSLPPTSSSSSSSSSSANASSTSSVSSCFSKKVDTSDCKDATTKINQSFKNVPYTTAIKSTIKTSTKIDSQQIRAPCKLVQPLQQKNVLQQPQQQWQRQQRSQHEKDSPKTLQSPSTTTFQQQKQNQSPKLQQNIQPKPKKKFHPSVEQQHPNVAKTILKQTQCGAVKTSKNHNNNNNNTRINMLSIKFMT